MPTAPRRAACAIFGTLDGKDLMYRVVLIAALAAPFAGCTTTRLRYKTEDQIETLSGLYQQQVLDNLALFASDPEAIPFFAYPSQGTATLSSQSGLSFSNLLQSQVQEAWQLTPVNDSRKLERMRCVYQRVIALHRRQPLGGDCPDCTRLLSAFYTGDPDLRVDQRDSGGSITIDCLEGSKWLAIGCKKCAPRRSPCPLGRHGDVRVWTMPGGGHELSKLTLTMLDYALHDPPAGEKKTVTFHLAEDGELTTSGKALADVSGQVAANAPSDSLMTLPYASALEHICAKNDYGLTVDVLRGLDLTKPATDDQRAVRDCYHITDDDWKKISDLLVKLRRHQVDSPLSLPIDAAKSTPGPLSETTILPAPTPD